MACLNLLCRSRPGVQFSCRGFFPATCGSRIVWQKRLESYNRGFYTQKIGVSSWLRGNCLTALTTKTQRHEGAGLRVQSHAIWHIRRTTLRAPRDRIIPEDDQFRAPAFQIACGSREENHASDSSVFWNELHVSRREGSGLREVCRWRGGNGRGHQRAQSGLSFFVKKRIGAPKYEEFML